MVNAQALLRSLVGEALPTLGRHQKNALLSVSGDDAVVATKRSPEGTAVPVSSVQAVLDRIAEGEVVPITPSAMGHRSSFIGAVLATVPYLDLSDDSPPKARLDPDAAAAPDVLAEYERRLLMYADLVEEGGPAEVEPRLLRALGIYGGASGVWVDASRTRGVGGHGSVAVGLLHTGRVYADELSDEGLLYHYPETDRPPGRDQSEIEALKAAHELRLPVFVILSEGATRTVRKAWIAAWDDELRVAYVEFGPTPVQIERPTEGEESEFDLFETPRRSLHLRAGRPNQQRFRLAVLRRYGQQCALCGVKAPELLTAAHLVPAEDKGTSDPRNGLVLCANHHAALDRGLLRIKPDNLRVVLRDDQDPSSLGVERSSVAHLRNRPAADALRYRWKLNG